MSTRSTPRAGSSHLPRTASFSSEVSFDPSRRHTRTDSLRLPTLAESSASAAQSSSGLSTPDTRRRRYLARKKSQDIKEIDWAGVEPDEVFRRLPVAEIRRVEQKMRTDALNKQSELRSMVGTRYRDLLTSATQITTLRSSSLRLSDSLKSISQACSNPSDVPQIREDGSDATETADVMSVLPVAAHVKLLLDAPEALYSSLSHHEYLNAAYLWLVARVTKEGLAKMPYEASGAYLDLAERQWETLLPFRAQIVSRATASLRSREKTDAKVVSETLLAIILLDNLTLSDALSLFLTQRSKAVRDILHHAPSSPTSPTVKTRRRSSAATRDKDQIGKVLKEAVSFLLDTVTLSQAVFDKRRKLDDDSMMEEMIRLVQKAEAPTPSTAQAAPPRRTSHERRASRLASISSPLPKLSFSTTGSPVSAQKVLQALPSAQILLRHLPPSITTFTPFITPSPSPAVNDRLTEWRSTSTSMLADAVPAWLAALQSIQDVWSIRAALLSILAEGDHQAQIRVALENEWAERVKAIWSVKLDAIVDIAREKLEEGVEKIRQSPEGENGDVSVFAFSELNYPAVPTASLASGGLLHSTSLEPFMSSLRQRSSGRTPLLSDTLSALESAASALQGDVHDLSSDLSTQYQSGVKDALSRLIGVLDETLAGLGTDGQVVEASLHVGRVAMYITNSSSILRDMGGDKSQDLDAIQSALIELHTRSTKPWQGRAVQAALAKLDSLFPSFESPSLVRTSWQSAYPTQPSDEISLALQSLVGATRLLGVPRGVETTVACDTVRAFVEQAKALEGWKDLKDAAAIQAAVDLGFLTLLNGEDVGKNEMVQSYLASIPAGLPDDFPSRLPRILADHLRRTQLLLHPLLGHLPPTSLPASQVAPTSRNSSNFLRYGPPPTSEFRSPVAVAKPGKRFGLLSIAV